MRPQATTGLSPAWLTPEWPVPRAVRALSTFRTGGASRTPYESCNLGSHVDDDPAAVAANRAALRIAAALPAEPVWLSQVHGVRVCDLDAPEPSVLAAGAAHAGAAHAAAADAGAAHAAAADAAVTRVPGRICAILTADCLPLLLATESGDRVGAAHAGWRGLAAGVIETTVQALDCAPDELLAWLGPAIGPRHFEVGAEVRDELLRGDPAAVAAFERNDQGRFMADLYALARRRLARVGVLRVYGGGDCTYARRERYFSHRRDGRTGRQASLIWLEGPVNR